MKEVITSTVLALVSAVLFTRFKNITDKEQKQKDEKKWFLISFAVYAVTGLITALMTSKADISLFGTISLILTANFIFLLGVIDLRHRKIPNSYVAAALVFRTLFIVIEGVAETDLNGLLLRSIAGLAAGGLITGMAYAISRKGIGSGDVKMFAVIGYCTGGAAAIDILVYSTLFCCICGIVLLVTKKCSKKDSIPMAPFAYAGTMLYIIAGM